MAETDMKLAKSTYKTLLSAVKANGWKCDVNKKELTIAYGVNDGDLHTNFKVFVDAERQLVRVLSKLPLKFPANKIYEGAIATGEANYALADGSFDFNVTNGEVLFRMTTSYNSIKISKEALLYLFNYSTWAIGKYYKKLDMISKGELSVSDFIAQI